MPINIALDGPAGAGKSTIAKGIAKKLDIFYLDTGSMYRAFAWKMLRENKDPKNENDVNLSLENTEIAIKFINKIQHVFADDIDVTNDIRTPEISQGASDVAVFPQVRIKLVEAQREAANKYDIVLDGRDIGTYVLPEAKNKFYITASSKLRSKRRYLELKEKGIERDLDELEREINMRDKNDSEREFAPLKRADDAIFVDTSDMSIDEAINFVLDRIEV